LIDWQRSASLRHVQILIASSNPGKRREIEQVFEACRAQKTGATHLPTVELVGLESLPQSIPEPVEDQPDFAGNAALKAVYYAKATGMWCIADDSGLEVDALGGDPGVRSARYAGIEGPRSVVDPENNRRLLRELGDRPCDQRTARFVCTMALARPGDDKPLCIVRGTIEGRILGPGDNGFVDADPPAGFAGRGENGFGYDPLFLVPDLGKTTAQLPPEHKNAISHRGDASRKMWRELDQFIHLADDSDDTRGCPRAG
jgi:XTP/dITP diphosphohydrolase